jgi:hypothetical protein
MCETRWQHDHPRSATTIRQGARVDLCVHPHRRAIGQRDLDQTWRPGCCGRGDGWRGCWHSGSWARLENHLGHHIDLGKTPNRLCHRGRLGCHQCMAPSVKLTNIDVVLERRLRRRGARCQAPRGDRLLLLDGPAAARFDTHDQLQSRDRRALMTARWCRNWFGRDRVRVHQPNPAYLPSSPLCGVTATAYGAAGSSG